VDESELIKKENNFTCLTLHPFTNFSFSLSPLQLKYRGNGLKEKYTNPNPPKNSEHEIKRKRIPLNVIDQRQDF